MNLLHMKYAVDVAETNSINKAAEKLYVGQSVLSRAIKELEASLGVLLFERSAKGMSLTPDGEIFVEYAKTILKQVDDVENVFRHGTTANKNFSVSGPRACYIADAFARFSAKLNKEEKIDVFYRETNSMRTIKNILEENYQLGILRYGENYDKYYKLMMEEKGLLFQLITEFSHVLVMNAESPLASLENITFDDLKDYTMIAHADPYVPWLPLSEVKKEELQDNVKQRIFVFERASQFELLAQNPLTYMWVSPIPAPLLARYGLVQRSCSENHRMYKDVLVYKKEYALSNLDKRFIQELIKSKQEILK